MFEKIVEDMAAARERYVESGRQAFRPAVDAFLAAHPEVDAVRWTQYSPHFNDGDACVFSVNDPDVRLAMSIADPAGGDAGPDSDSDEEDEDEDEDCGEWMSAWDLGYEDRTKGFDFTPKLKADLESLAEFFGSIEDVMEELFGDGYRVTVSRVGDPLVEEYDHD